MRALKLIVDAIVLLIVLPVVIVGVLGLALSPFQTVARATEPRPALEANDLMLSEAVKNQAREHENEAAPLVEADAEEDAGAEGHDGLDLDVEAEELAELSSHADEGEYAASSSCAESEEPVVSSSYAEMEEPADSGSYAEVPADAEAEQAALVSYEEVDSADGTYGAGQASDGYYTSEELRTMGVIYDGGLSYTWYSQRVLPGGGLDIEGRGVSSEGYVTDGQGRIVVASSDIPYGTEISVPFGSGTAVVLDTGCPSGVVDVYTDF